MQRASQARCLQTCLGVTRNRRILVVDDEANARAALAELLRDEHFEVATATHGVDALQVSDVFRPHVAITDLQMPHTRMTGVELIERLRRLGEPPAIIAMTAFGEIATAIAALRAGAIDYLIKPIHFDELLVVLDKALWQYDLEHEIDRLRRDRRTTNQRAMAITEKIPC